MRRKTISCFVSIYVVLFSCVLAFASPTTPEQAKQVVQGWLSLAASPLGTRLATQVSTVQSYDDATGQPAYYIVNVGISGFVIVPADDEVEPIIGFSPVGSYDSNPANPLATLVSRDIPGRLAVVRSSQATPAASAPDGLTPRQKWQTLEATASGARTSGSLTSISDTRVNPLTLTTWSQSNDGNGQALYNIYTPSHYLTGCTATAMAQLMRFHQFPVGNVPTTTFDVWVTTNNVTTKQSMTIQGGNGSGGPYQWSYMTLSPNNSTYQTNREAISHLMADAGASVNMSYSASSSGAWYNVSAYKNVFGYASAKEGGYGSTSSHIPSASWTAMMNPSLDAGLPITMSIFTSDNSSGHSIVCDGYGYDTSTPYHHMNMGWSGSDDVWYNLPTILNYSVINHIIYNLSPYGGGEIIGGRIVDGSGNPIAGTRVTATLAGGSKYYTWTNYRGIYSIKNVASGSSVSLHAAKPGYQFTDSQVSVGTSEDGTTTTGNVWGGTANFTGASVTLAGALTKMATGGGHTLALAANGTVWAWGNNASGQLGTGDTVSHTKPVRVTGLPSGVPATDVAAGRNHSLVLLSDGTVRAFGSNSNGQLGNGSVDANAHPTPTQVSGLTGMSGVSAGASNSSSARNSSGLWTWGQNDHGQLGLGNTLDQNQPTQVSITGTTATVKGVAMGRDHTLIFLSNGKAYAFGDNSHGQLGLGNTTSTTAFDLNAPVIGLSGVKQVAVGDNFSLALKTDGLVYSFGQNNLGQLGNGDTNGTDQTQPVLIPGLYSVENVEAGDAYGLLRKSDGSVWAFGDNSGGQLGNGNPGVISRTPVQMSGPAGVVMVAAGGRSGLVPSASGTVWAVGDNTHGQLGTGNTTPQTTAARIAFNIESPNAGAGALSGLPLLLYQGN